MSKKNDHLTALVNQILNNPDLPFTEEDRAWLEAGDAERLVQIGAFRRSPGAPPNLAAAIRRRAKGGR